MSRGGPRPGSGRPYVPAAERKLPIGFGATLATIAAIDAEVRRVGLPSRSVWLRNIVDEALDKAAPKKTKKKAAKKKAKKKAAKTGMGTPERYELPTA